MISHRHRCIYVKVPKCASTTVLDWFADHGGGWHSFRPDWYGGLLADRIRDLALAVNLYPDYFTFSFVRDPYERFASTWLQARRVAASQTHLAGDWPPPERLGDLRDFAELCREILVGFRRRWGRDALRLFRAHGEREYGPGKIKLKYLRWVVNHIPPQADFLPDCNPALLYGVRRVEANPLGFLGSVENIDRDFARLADALELPRRPLPVSNASRADGDGSYSALYDAATRRLVEEIYADDFRLTDYGFRGIRAAVGVPAVARAKAGTRRARRTPRTLPARAWRRLCALEISAEERLVRSPAARRVLRPAVYVGKIIRGLPR